MLLSKGVKWASFVGKLVGNEGNLLLGILGIFIVRKYREAKWELVRLRIKSPDR
jgi:hypothetical protein